MAAGQLGWGDVGAIAEAVSAVVLAGTLVFTYITYRKQVRENERQRSLQHYHAIDVFYFQILRMAVNHPYVRSKEFIEKWAKPDSSKPINTYRRARYDLYAFIVWNFLETIYDRCQTENNSLWQTWEPIFLQDGKLHLAWFEKEENMKNFKEIFIDDVCKTFEIKRAACTVAGKLPGRGKFN